MPDDDLTPIQRSALLILMAEAQEVPNANLTNDHKLELKKQRRDDLEERGLLKVRREGRLLHLELSDHGWNWCRAECGATVPASAGHGGSAAYAMLAGIQRYLDRHRLSLPEFFARVAEAQPPAEPDGIDEATVTIDTEARIRKAYLELATGSGAWVKLADLRPLLAGLARADIDHALIIMNRTPDVSIVPESNQKALSEQDRAAAVQIGNQAKHLIAIGPS